MNYPSVAVVIPCLNEEQTIAKVVKDFATAFPQARIVVFDNNSSDRTAEAAAAAGAEVRPVMLRGKGNVVRRMFADIDVDYYILVDGDDTYDASVAPQMLEEVCTNNLDMVVGVRAAESPEAYRRGHRFGNRMFNKFVASLFGDSPKDIFSGYRILTRRFVKSFPAQSSGFETETELTIHALELSMAIGEITVTYSERGEDSFSKLNTFRDGQRIFWTILKLYRIQKPLAFFGGLGTILFIVSLLLAAPLFITYLETGLVPRFPTAILSTGLALMGALSAFSGLVLDTVAHGRRELKMLAYLGTPAPGCGLVVTSGSPAGGDSNAPFV